MKKLLLLFLLISFTSQAQFKKIFKYSTVYASYDQNNSIQPMQSFAVSANNDLIETTPRTPADQTLTIGIRKLAFFEYENRDQFYNGTETNIGKSANIGNAKGLEYLFEYSKGRQQRSEFENSQMFVRYLANYWVAKVERTKNELVDLDYKLADS